MRSVVCFPSKHYFSPLPCVTLPFRRVINWNLPSQALQYTFSVHPFAVPIICCMSGSMIGCATRHRASPSQSRKHRVHLFSMCSSLSEVYAEPVATEAWGVIFGFRTPQTSFCSLQSAFWHSEEQYFTLMLYSWHCEHEC